MSRSGSGTSAVYNRARKASSVTADSVSLPSAMSMARSFAARSNSARPPYEMNRLRTSRWFVAVCDVTRSTAAAAAGVRRSRSPSTHTHALLIQFFGLARDVLLEQRHERGNLGRRTLPVLLRECEERQMLQAHLDRALHHLAHRLHAGAVTERPREHPLAGPTPVAIHDDGNVAGDRTVKADAREQVSGGHEAWRAAEVRPP